MRMGDADERAVEIGRYIVRSGATVRATAVVFGVSKSTVWKDQTRLRRQSPALWREVQQVLQKNKAERHLRGGEATRQKFLRQNALHPPDLPRRKVLRRACTDCIMFVKKLCPFCRSPAGARPGSAGKGRVT